MKLIYILVEIGGFEAIINLLPKGQRYFLTKMSGNNDFQYQQV